MNNSILNVDSCQYVSKINPVPFFINEANVGFYFKQATKSELNILDQLIRLSRKHKVIYVSQQTLAKWCNVTRQYLNRIIKHLCHLGLIGKDYRHMQTCRYTVSSFFNLSEVRRIGSKYIKCLQTFSLSLLTQLNKLSFKKVHSVQIDSYCGSSTRLKRKKKGRSMHIFSPQELEVIAQYPNEAIKFANRMFTKDLHEGKTISSPFEYFISILKNHANKVQVEKNAVQKQKTPIMRMEMGGKNTVSDNGYFVGSNKKAYKAASVVKMNKSKEFQSENAAKVNNTRIFTKSPEEIERDRQKAIQVWHEKNETNKFAQILMQGWQARPVEEKVAQSVAVDWNNLVFAKSKPIAELSDLNIPEQHLGKDYSDF